MQRLVSICKIFSDINRVNILALLQREKELCVCEICDTLELSQPLVSRHLKQMRVLDIVSLEKKGKWVVYGLKEDKTVNSLLSEIKDESYKIAPLVKCSRR